MARLPVIVGFGGINSAGRSSSHHAYRRMVMECLPQAARRQSLLALASLMGLLTQRDGGWLDSQGQVVDPDVFLAASTPLLLDGSLVRRLETNLFDPDHIPFHKQIALSGKGGRPVEFLLNRRHLPERLPVGWQVTEDADHPGKVHVLVNEGLDVLLQCQRQAEVNSAGQLPSGFDPAAFYPAKSHPRGLQLTVYAASDAINSLGIDWGRVREHVALDRISVYAGSCLSQLDYDGFGGLLQARLLGRKVTSKQLPLGLAEMPADFVNAYILGNLGANGTNVAACATFLYNLRQGIRDIQSGSHRIAIIGASEAPLVPEVFDGFLTMGALADDDKLRDLDGLSRDANPDCRRACRPFGDNVGFTLGEAAQFVVLFDDELALELGANLYGAVNDVFVNADGFKKSIAGPGVGNYISMAKAAAATRNIIGDEGLRRRSYVQAHGTGTPQNRTSESQILSQIAGSFGIEAWPVAAVKAYVGHSLATAAGDQLVASLGVWEHGIIPGIRTTRSLAEDVESRNLDILLDHKEVGADSLDAVLINSKGFGGNNASASILSPRLAEQMLERKHGKRAMQAYYAARERTRAQTTEYDQRAIRGEVGAIYRFGEGVLEPADVGMDPEELRIAGLAQPVDLKVPDHYREFLE